LSRSDGVFAAECGKSFLQVIISEVLGGRVADPFSWMVGKHTSTATWQAQSIGDGRIHVLDVDSSAEQIRAKIKDAQSADSSSSYEG